MSYVPSESDAVSSLYALHFYEVLNTQTSPLTMDSFYARIIPLGFQSAKEASSYCRQLAKEYGFTMKQETSSNRNIYIYCSREGVADTSKQTKRKRSSIKCDCKWRIVLFKEDNSQWKFRKSNNPQYAEHNHDLVPEDIPAPWPSNVIQRIAEYADSGFPTGEIRQLMQQEFPNLPWDERRFYNRLAEERKKIKVRETEKRVIETVVLAARVASLACSSNEYTNKVKTVLQQAFDDICESANIDSTSVVSLSQDNMTTISLPSSSTADIVCNYPAGCITVKNIPAQKGRPPKKNIHSKSQSQIEQLQEVPYKSQNDLTALQQSELASTHSQNQTESSINLQDQSEFEPQERRISQLSQSQSQVQFQSQHQFLPPQETANIQEELCQSNVQSSQCNSNEHSLLLQTQPQSQMNFYSSDDQRQEQFCYSQPQSHVQDNNRPLVSLEHPEMRFDPHLHFQSQPFDKYEQQILASQSYSSQIPERTNFEPLPTQTLQEMLLNSYPQTFTQLQEKNTKQKLRRFASTSTIQPSQNLLHQFNLVSEFQSRQELQEVNQAQLTLYSSSSIQFMNTNMQNQKQQISTTQNIRYEKARKKHRYNKPPTYNKPLQILKANV